ncbi:PD-(D/E)XK nuclease family protein [Chloroflexota bacterium]
MIDFKELAYARVTKDHPLSGRLHPSSLSGCIRQEMYRFHGYTKTHRRSAWECWMLDRFGWYEQAFRGIGLPSKQQFAVGNEMWSGRIDDLIEIPDGGMMIVDYKSISPWYKSKLPLLHNIPQIHAYVWLAENMGMKVHSAVLVYIDRWDDSPEKNEPEPPKIRQYDVTPGAGDLQPVRELMDQFEHWARQNGAGPGTAELPDRPYGHPEDHRWDCVAKQWKKWLRTKEWQIRCPYFGHCWPEYVAQYTPVPDQDPDPDLPF